MQKKNVPPADAIIFGLNRTTDEQSIVSFFKLFSSDALLSTLVPRLTDREIATLTDILTGLMRQHLSEQEYHRLFLDGQP